MMSTRVRPVDVGPVHRSPGGASENQRYAALHEVVCMGAAFDELTLHLERVLPAPRLVVFRAHAEPDLLARWWGPRGFSAPNIEVDLRVGGGYRIAMQPPDGLLFYLSGEFLEVEPPTRLVYTFRWEDPDPDDREMVVTFSLGDLGGSTELHVDQGGFATEGRRALHEQGWTESLDRLQALISSREWPGNE
jgi:uncharacterized protein YndB with AHSA1/START domain